MSIQPLDFLAVCCDINVNLHVVASRASFNNTNTFSYRAVSVYTYSGDVGGLPGFIKHGND